MEKETKRCAYCGKEKPIEEMMESRLFYRKSSGASATAMKWYCKGTGCAGYDQMGHED